MGPQSITLRLNIMSNFLVKLFALSGYHAVAPEKIREEKTNVK